MARIFINYRRDDAQGAAGRLFDHLALKYSRRELFMDVDAMQPGLDFAKQLDAQVSQCHVLVAVIGPHWLNAQDQAGKRRLDSNKDYVRIELASALKRDIAVIPVLVDGAAMPSEDSLSDDLKPLARRHALELRHTRFNADADAIVHALEAVVPRRRVPWTWVGGGVALAAAAAAPAGATMLNTDLQGSSYRNFELSSDNASLCQEACKADSQCRAWTYVHPGLQGPNARCWLTNAVPQATANSCCSSGIERAETK